MNKRCFLHFTQNFIPVQRTKELPPPAKFKSQSFISAFCVQRSSHYTVFSRRAPSFQTGILFSSFYIIYEPSSSKSSVDRQEWVYSKEKIRGKKKAYLSWRIEKNYPLGKILLPSKHISSFLSAWREILIKI